MHHHLFCSDSEGPLCLNDNAFELAQVFIPQGDKLFAMLSAYDDYLADIVKRPGYKAGDTLKLILPFLKAYGATNQAIEDYSKQAVAWVPDAKESLKYIKARFKVVIITTSYEQFARPMYRQAGIPEENIYCTALDLDGYNVPAQEIEWIKKLALEMLAMPPLILDQPLSKDTKAAIKRLEEIFWQEIWGGKCGRLLQGVEVMGGQMKAQAIRDSIKQTGLNLEQVMFVGDSITDVEAFKLVRQAGGVSISFNGNAYALAEAEFACISPTVYTTAAMAYAFAWKGRYQVHELAQDLNETALAKSGVPKDLIQHVFSGHSSPPLLEIITPDNRQELIEKSQHMRKVLRGEQIGALG